MIGLLAWGAWSGWNWFSERSAASAVAEQRAAAEKRGIASFTGQWSGRYTCAQGLTAARLELTSQADGTVVGRFEFSPYAGTRGGRGAFQVAGTPQGDTVTLHGGKWIHQPAGYRPIDLRVRLAKGPPRRLEGQVLTQGCGAVELQEARTP